MKNRAIVMVDYYPAEVKIGKETIVSFYVRDPQNNQMVRKRIRLNRIKQKKNRERQARKICQEINLKLANGWNPIVEQEAPRGFVKVYDMIDRWMDVKRKESKHTTIRSYESYVKLFKEWMTKNSHADIYCVNFKKVHAVAFTNYLYDPEGKNYRERSFNGFLSGLNSMFNWAVAQNYMRENPFRYVKMKRPRKKKRKLVSPEVRSQLKEYLIEAKEQEYYCMVLLAFYGLLRPLEILALKIRDVNLDSGIIVLPASMSKDNDDRFITLPDFVVAEMKKLKLNEYPTSYYIFSKKFRPGKTKNEDRAISHYWDRHIRPKAKLPQDIQFYSLKDSGIMQMLADGVPPNEVKDQAGHSDLRTTNEYLKHVRPEGSDKIKKNTSKF